MHIHNVDFSPYSNINISLFQITGKKWARCLLQKSATSANQMCFTRCVENIHQQKLETSPILLKRNISLLMRSIPSGHAKRLISILGIANFCKQWIEHLRQRNKRIRKSTRSPITEIWRKPCNPKDYCCYGGLMLVGKTWNTNKLMWILLLYMLLHQLYIVKSFLLPHSVPLLINLPSNKKNTIPDDESGDEEYSVAALS